MGPTWQERRTQILERQTWRFEVSKRAHKAGKERRNHQTTNHGVNSAEATTKRAVLLVRKQKENKRGQNDKYRTVADNLSTSYAERAEKWILRMMVSTLLLQRWRRQRLMPRKHQRLLWIIVGGRAQIVRECISYLNDHPREDSLMKRHVFVLEKFDGMNVGVRWAETANQG